MRIVGGRFRGRTLEAPKSQAIRPTADRLRESLFNILVHAYGDPIVDARVLDLFAGTGALGFEALSRGAAFVLFVDDGAEARALLRGNVEALGVGGATKVYRRDATRLGPVSPLEPFSLAFLDPPYGKGLAEQALAAARDGGWLSPGALAVVEEAADARVQGRRRGFEELERRTYDDTEFVFLRLSLRARSIHADSRRLDHLAPALDVFLHELGVVGRGALLRRQNFQTEGLQLLADIGPGDHRLERLVHLVDDRLGRALREEEAVPYRGLDAGQPCSPVVAMSGTIAAGAAPSPRCPSRCFACACTAPL